MKIAIFSDTYPPQVNGVANVVFDSAKELAERGHQVRIFTLSNPKNKKETTSTVKNLKVYTVPSIPAFVYPGLRLTVPLGLTLRRLRAFRPDIIHTHTPFAMGWESVMGAKILKIPLVGSHHTFFDHYLKHVKLDFEYAKKFSWKYVIKFYEECDLLITPSEALKEAFLKNGFEKKVIALPNPINPELFRPVVDRKTKEALREKKFGIRGQTIVHMGRISYEKNIPVLIEMFSLLKKKIKELNFLIVGEGPEIPKLKKLCLERGLENSVVFTGLKKGEKLVEALQVGDVFVTASKSETFCLSVLEAMAVGLPAVVVGKKGVKELIADGENGFLSFSGKPEDLALKIEKILKNDSLAKEFALNSRKIALKYSRKKIIAQLEEIYRKVAE